MSGESPALLRIGSQGIELGGRCETLRPFLESHLSLLEHVHELDANQRALGYLERLESQHGARDPLDRAMVLLNGMVTNDKFCLIRRCQVRLRWSRQPYRFRPRKSDDLLDETSHREGSHDTLLADTSAIPANGGRGAALGSSVSIPTAMDHTDRAVRHARTITRTT